MCMLNARQVKLTSRGSRLPTTHTIATDCGYPHILESTSSYSFSGCYLLRDNERVIIPLCYIHGG